MLRAVTNFLGLPFLSRALGLLLLAAGFVQVVYDGARSIANNTVQVTSVRDALFTFLPDRANALQSSVESVAPWLWQVIVAPLTLAPAFVVAFVLGTILLWLGQPAREPIGFLTRP